MRRGGRQVSTQNVLRNPDREPFELRLAVPPETVRSILWRIADALRPEGSVRLRLGDAKFDSGPGQVLRVDRPGGTGHSGAAGHIFLLPMGKGTLLQVPKGRGAADPTRAFDADPKGQYFSLFLAAALQELQRLRLVSGRWTFKSEADLESAKQALTSAQNVTDFQGIGNACRTALIILANELYEPSMTPDDADQPQGDATETKLKYAAQYYANSFSEREKEGFEKVIKGVWGFVSSLVHNKRAEVRDAEVAVALTEGLFQAFSHIRQRT